MLNLTPFSTTDWFTNAFIELFGYACYNLMQCGIYLFTALFLQFAFDTIFILYRYLTITKIRTIRTKN